MSGAAGRGNPACLFTEYSGVFLAFAIESHLIGE